jgi:REP element-mobilizing transposase RayT
MPLSTTQLHFDLPPPARWGGARLGAGRKRDPNSGARHTSRAPFKRLPAHVTLRMREGIPSLRGTSIVREIERAFARGCARPGFRLVHYSLQGNHAHLIVEAVDADALGRGMKSIGARLARAVNRISGHHGPVLAERYHLHLLPTPTEVRNALRYVLLNARRHAASARAALGGPIGLDPASSARWFDGWNRSVPGASEVRAAGADPPVARARTWLLAVGWRRHGLIDPADVPGWPDGSTRGGRHDNPDRKPKAQRP